MTGAGRHAGLGYGAAGAEVQSRLLTQTTLRDFAELWPGKFLNETNGVSPRRFLRLANPRLSGLITARARLDGPS